MESLILPFLLLWFIGVLKAGFDYVNDLHEKELELLNKKVEFRKDKALKIECRRVRKFLNPDGSVNTRAAKEYLEDQKRREKRAPQYLDFLEVK